MTISWPQRSFLESPLFLNIFFIILILPVALIFSQYGPPCRVTTSPLINKGGSCISHLTIGSYVSVRSSRYEARRKFGEHKRCVRVALDVAESNSSFLSARFVCWRHERAQ